MEKREYFKILIVEDEKEIREMMSIVLLREGYAIDAVSTTEAARHLMTTKSYDLLVLDWMLPDESGIDLLKYLRQGLKKLSFPILMVTAKAEPEEIIQGLDLGADDYLTKPFDIRVLVARVAALIRRGQRQPQDSNKDRLQFGELGVDKPNMQVQLQGQPIELTSMEFRLLCALLENPNVVLTREKILTLTQGSDINVLGRTVDTHLFSLRKKLAPWSESITTVRGVGYRFTPMY